MGDDLGSLWEQGDGDLRTLLCRVDAFLAGDDLGSASGKHGGPGRWGPWNALGVWWRPSFYGEDESLGRRWTCWDWGRPFFVGNDLGTLWGGLCGVRSEVCPGPDGSLALLGASLLNTPFVSLADIECRLDGTLGLPADPLPTTGTDAECKVSLPTIWLQH